MPLPKLGIQSTTVGRYQLLRRYYDAYKKALGLKAFSPLSEDEMTQHYFDVARARLPGL